MNNDPVYNEIPIKYDKELEEPALTIFDGDLFKANIEILLSDTA